MTAIPPSETPTRPPMSAGARAGLVLVLVFAIGALVPLIGGGHPTRTFYVFLAVLAIALAAFAYWKPLAHAPQHAPIESPGKAAAYAAVWGITEGGVVWLLYYFALGDSTMWLVALAIGVLAAVSRYWRGRKLPHALRAQLIVGVVVIGVALIMKLAARG